MSHILAILVLPILGIIDDLILPGAETSVILILAVLAWGGVVCRSLMLSPSKFLGLVGSDIYILPLRHLRVWCKLWLISEVKTARTITFRLSVRHTSFVFFAVFTIKDAIEVFLGVRKEKEALKVPDCRLPGFNQGNKIFAVWISLFHVSEETKYSSPWNTILSSLKSSYPHWSCVGSGGGASGMA